MKSSLQRKLQGLVERHEELKALLSDAGVISQQNMFREYSKEYSHIEPVVEVFQKHEAYIQQRDNAREIVKRTRSGNAATRARGIKARRRTN